MYLGIFRRLCIVLSFLIVMPGCQHQNQSKSSTKVIYDEDDRKAIGQIQESYRPLAKAVAAILRKGTLTRNDSNNGWTIERTYSSYIRSLKGKPLCETEVFRNEPSISDCSAFLIDEDTVATASHCVRSIDHCSQSLFHFGFVSTSNPAVFMDSEVYSCSEILKRDMREDIVLIKLDRSPSIPSLELMDTSFTDVDKVFVMGHPMGLPMKFAGPVQIRSFGADKKSFRANLDTYMGNSGSPVFDNVSKKVVGLIRSGAADFDDSSSCVQSRVCTANTCAGEDVVSSVILNRLISNNDVADADIEISEDFSGDANDVRRRWDQVSGGFTISHNSIRLTADSSRVSFLRKSPEKVVVTSNLDFENDGGESVSLVMHYSDAQNALKINFGTGSSFSNGITSETQSIWIQYGNKTVKRAEVNTRSGKLEVESDRSLVRIKFNDQEVITYQFQNQLPAGDYAGFEIYSYPSPFGVRRGPVLSNFSISSR